MCRSSTFAVLADFGPLHGLLLADFRSLSNFHDWRNPGCVYVSLINNPRFYRFRALSWTITHRFAVPKRFRCLLNPKMFLHAGRQDSQIGPILARFLDYYSVLGSRSDFHDWWTPGCIYVSVINTHNFGRFWYVLCTVTHRCGVPERFPWLTIPGVRLRARRQPSQFWPILTRFVNYYSPFWDPKAISIVIEPQGALTCWSSTVTVLADSGPFCRLLLTFLGS